MAPHPKTPQPLQESAEKVTQFIRPMSSERRSPVGFVYRKPTLPMMDFSRKHTRENQKLPNTALPMDLPAMKDSEHEKELFSSHNAHEIENWNATASSLRDEDLSLRLHPTSYEPSNAVDDKTGEVQTSGKDSGFIVSGLTSRAEDGIAERVENIGDEHDKSTRSREIICSASPKEHQSMLQRSEHSSTLRSPERGVNSIENEDLFSLLISRFKQERLKRESLEASQQANKTEIEALREVSNTLYQNLQSAKERDIESQSQLSKLQSLAIKWKNRIQRLGGQVKELEDDHHRLRRDAEDLRKNQGDIQNSKLELGLMIREANESMNADRSKNEKAFQEARTYIQALGQTIEHQEIQRCQSESIINIERERSRELKDEFKRFVISHEGLKDTFTGHCNAVMEKLGHIVNRTDTLQRNADTLPEDKFEPWFNRCIQILQDIQAATSTKPPDLHDFDASMKDYIER